MFFQLLKVLTFCCLTLELANCASVDEHIRVKNKRHNGETNEQREGKLFSLFSIVTFKNDACRSLGSFTGGSRNGTCLTSNECSSKGGQGSGNCAAGFGVCCVFIVTTSGGTISQNCTYIRNPNFPSAYGSTTAASYTIQKCSADVCDVRLDFESFNLAGPTITTEISGPPCTDTFTVNTSSGSSTPTICGKNNGQHVYLDMGTGSSDTSTLAFTFDSTQTSSRSWEIKVTQISCNNPSRPPDGCLQYQQTLTGRITTFNWEETGIKSHLEDQNYSVCIRRERGYCCIQYMACADSTESITLDTAPAAAGTAEIDTQCSMDYIGIEGSGGACSQSTNGVYHSRYCGIIFAPVNAANGKSNTVVCDCTTPFRVNIYTDKVSDIAANAANTIASRGICLDYQQVPCT